MKRKEVTEFVLGRKETLSKDNVTKKKMLTWYPWQLFLPSADQNLIPSPIGSKTLLRETFSFKAYFFKYFEIALM